MIEKNKVSLFQCRRLVQMVDNFAEHDARAFIKRESGNAGSDRGKCNCPQSFFRRDAQGVRRGAAQSRSGCYSAQLHARRVDHMAGFEASACCEGSSSNRNASNFIAFPLDFFPALSPNGSGDAAAKNQIVVGGVDDGIGLHFGQVALHENDFFFNGHTQIFTQIKRS